MLVTVIGLQVEDKPILDPNISKETLDVAYGEMATILLQLGRESFSKIGSLEEVDGAWSVIHRPLTMNMSQLVSNANFPSRKLPSSIYESKASYLADLADAHLSNFSLQRNDVVVSLEDAKWKYLARHLFRKLIARLYPVDLTPTADVKPFKLFSDDFRPSNVLVDKDNIIVSVLDWEFCYTAPAEFAYSPPWWLLLEPPEEWPSGIHDWTTQYERRLSVFLAAMREREDAMIANGQLTESQRLAGKMQESWDSGHFWVSYVARKAWAFDVIFWHKVNSDERFFEKPGYDEGLKLLSQEERDVMEDFAQRKVREMEEATLVDWDESDM